MGHEQTDEDLMIAYMRGDFSAFAALYGRFSGKVYGYLRKRVMGPLADDIHQAVFLKLHEVRSQYKKEFKFAPWLFVIARTTMIDQLRKKERNKEIATENLESFAGIGSQDRVQAIDHLQELPQADREILKMRYESGHDFEEIARHLNTSAQNVRQKISRAIRKLRLMGKRNE